MPLSMSRSSAPNMPRALGALLTDSIVQFPRGLLVSIECIAVHSESAG